MRYEKGSTTYAILRDWPRLQGRLSKVNWTKVTELARRLVTSSLTVLSGEDRIAHGSSDFLKCQSDLPVQLLSVEQVLNDDYEVDSPKTCLLVLSRSGKAGRTAEAVKAFRKRQPEARVLLLASRQSPVARNCHCGITPPGVDDLTSVGPTADLILLWMTALIGDAIKAGSYLPACQILDEDLLVSAVESSLSGIVGKQSQGVIWAAQSLGGIASVLAKAAERFSGCRWEARTLSIEGSPEGNRFHLILGRCDQDFLQPFQGLSGLTVGSDKPESDSWRTIQLPDLAELSPFNLYRIGLEVCWLWSLWSGHNPDQYFTLSDESQPEEQIA